MPHRAMGVAHAPGGAGPMTDRALPGTQAVRCTPALPPPPPTRTHVDRVLTAHGDRGGLSPAHAPGAPEILLWRCLHNACPVHFHTHTAQ